MKAKLLGKYILSEQIGKGAFSIVYKAFNIEDKKNYAIKQISL